MTAFLLVIAQLATATPILPPPCTSRVETDGERVTRLRGELRSAELAIMASRVNAGIARKRGKAR